MEVVRKYMALPPNICTFLNFSCKTFFFLSVLVPEEQKALKRHEKAASSGKDWLGDISPQTLADSQVAENAVRTKDILVTEQQKENTASFQGQTMSLPVSGHLSLYILLLTGIPSLHCHLNKLISVIFKLLSHSPSSLELLCQGKHPATVSCSCSPGQICCVKAAPMLPLSCGGGAGRAGWQQETKPSWHRVPGKPSLLCWEHPYLQPMVSEDKIENVLNWSSCTPNGLLTNLLPKELSSYISVLLKHVQ